jgi:hypothetical protein
MKIRGSKFRKGAKLPSLFPQPKRKIDFDIDLFNPKEGHKWMSPNLSPADSE